MNRKRAPGRAETIEFLRSIGAVMTRRRSTHEQWRLPNGHNITVPVEEGNAGKKAWNPTFAHRRWSDLQRLLKKERRA